MKTNAKDFVKQLDTSSDNIKQCLRYLDECTNEYFVDVGSFKQKDYKQKLEHLREELRQIESRLSHAKNNEEWQDWINIFTVIMFLGQEKVAITYNLPK